MKTNSQASTASRETPLLSSEELDVLQACKELTVRNRELTPLLAATLGVANHEVFYTWVSRKYKQSGLLAETDWSYFFHGLECDLRNTKDGRLLRIDFGPGGRLNTFTMWGVLQFVMTSKPPWPEFENLKRLLAEEPPSYNEFAGSFKKMSDIWDRLEMQGVFEQADASLVEFQAQYTSIGPDGIRVVKYPAQTSPETAADCAVAHRPRISAIGEVLLQKYQAGATS